MSGSSPEAVLYDRDGSVLPVDNGVPYPSDTPTLLMGGSDGTNARYILVDSSGRQILVGAGTAGTPTGGVITVQGDPSGTPQPISGTVTANAGSGNFAVVQATAANLNATIVGTVTANIGTTNGLALDATLAKLTIAQGTSLGTNTQALIGGSVTTVSPTYTTGQISPISITTAGAIRIDGSGVTQPVSGTVTANAGTGNFTVVQATASNLNATVTGTVTANIGTTNGLALDATLTGGTQTTRITDGTNTATVKAASTAAAATDKALVVAISPNNSVTITGTVTANQGTPNTLANKWPVQITDGTNVMPTGDVASRASYTRLTDGTNTIGTLFNTLYSDPNGDRRTIHNNATLTTSGSTVLTWVGHSEWYLITNIKNAPTGTTPKIQFKIQQLDPIDQTTVLTGERSFTGTLMSAAGTDVIEVPELVSDTLKISWTVTGTTPSFTGVNVTFCGHGSGNAIEGQAQVGELAGDAPVPVALVDVDGYIQRIRGDSLGDIAIATNLANAFSPDPRNWIGDPQPLTSDPSSNLITRGQVLTDEGSFRDDFGGSSLLTSLTGTYTFTNGSTVVTGVGTLFTSELANEKYIRLTAHANSALAAVEQIIDDTNLVLSTAYTGANGSGAASKSNWTISVAAGPANLTVGSSLVNLLNSTVNGASVAITRDGDYLPFAMVAVLSLSQRIANQQTVIGFEDVPQAATQFVQFLFDGTDNTKVKCRTAHDTDSIQETQITLPAGATTAVANVYVIDQLIDRTIFYVNGTQVANHQTHLPGPYDLLSQVAYITNTGTAGSQTTVSIDSVFFYDHDIIDLSEPVNIQGTVGGQPVVIQFGTPGGGTSLPKIIDVYYNKSDGAIVANVFKRVATYTVPAAYNGYLIKFTSFQGEAASSRVVSETNMGSHNDNTNVFTSGSSYTSPQWAAVVQAEVTTAFASGSGNVTLTVTYTNEVGTGSRSGTIAIPKGSAVGSRWDLALQGSDLGVQSIQAVSGSPTQVGVAKILGLLQLALHQDQSTTTQTETLFAPGAITFPTGTVLGLEYNGGTVSKTRNLDMLVQLIQ